MYLATKHFGIKEWLLFIRKYSPAEVFQTAACREKIVQMVFNQSNNLMHLEWVHEMLWNSSK